jgi:hypothetical protein
MRRRPRTSPTAQIPGRPGTRAASGPPKSSVTTPTDKPAREASPCGQPVATARPVDNSLTRQRKCRCPRLKWSSGAGGQPARPLPAGKSTAQTSTTARPLASTGTPRAGKASLQTRRCTEAGAAAQNGNRHTDASTPTQRQKPHAETRTHHAETKLRTRGRSGGNGGPRNRPTSPAEPPARKSSPSSGPQPCRRRRAGRIGP